jgi:hypothetical protein
MSRQKNSITVCLDDGVVKLKELSWGTANDVNAGT